MKKSTSLGASSSFESWPSLTGEGKNKEAKLSKMFLLSCEYGQECFLGEKFSFGIGPFSEGLAVQEADCHKLSTM